MGFAMLSWETFPPFYLKKKGLTKATHWQKEAFLTQIGYWPRPQNTQWLEWRTGRWYVLSGWFEATFLGISFHKKVFPQYSVHKRETIVWRVCDKNRVPHLLCTCEQAWSHPVTHGNGIHFWHQREGPWTQSIALSYRCKWWHLSWGVTRRG